MIFNSIVSQLVEPTEKRKFVPEVCGVWHWLPTCHSGVFREFAAGVRDRVAYGCSKGA
jgi:hypothetical protein